MAPFSLVLGSGVGRESHERPIILSYSRTGGGTRGRREGSFFISRHISGIGSSIMALKGPAAGSEQVMT